MATTAYAYKYDEHGHYEHSVLVMEDPLGGGLLVPSDCVEFAPDEDKLKSSWAKLNADKTAWEYTVKPTAASECIGMSVKHSDQCMWAHEVRALFETLCNADNEHYRVVRDDNLTQTVEAIPEKTFEELQTAKLQNLESKASQFDNLMKCDAMVIKSSLGFNANADIRSQNNIDGLLSADKEPVQYRDADNVFHSLSLNNLSTLKIECIQNGQNLYVQKWAYQQQILACTTKEELDAIELNFVMMDFSAAE